jgi:hypothetical protein
MVERPFMISIQFNDLLIRDIAWFFAFQSADRTPNLAAPRADGSLTLAADDKPSAPTLYGRLPCWTEGIHLGMHRERTSHLSGCEIGDTLDVYTGDCQDCADRDKSINNDSEK